jgi:Protein of unknown function (DUF1681)
MVVVPLYIHNTIAEQWDLAKPIQTCGFQVERRNNDLYLLFTTENHTKLFALAKLHSERAAKSVEPVMDSSRYFVVQIQQQQQQQHASGGAIKSVYVGFGFRDRDIALDLLGNLQQFQKSIQREQQAKTMKVAEIPKLADGEKIHISLFGSSSPHTNNNNHKTTDIPKKKTKSGTGTGGPIVLLKKPPKVETSATGTTNATTDRVEETTTGLATVHLQDDTTTAASATVATTTQQVSAAPAPAAATVAATDDNEEDEWGDFEQA